MPTITWSNIHSKFCKTLANIAGKFWSNPSAAVSIQSPRGMRARISQKNLHTFLTAQNKLCSLREIGKFKESSSVSQRFVIAIVLAIGDQSLVAAPSGILSWKVFCQNSSPKFKCEQEFMGAKFQRSA